MGRFEMTGGIMTSGIMTLLTGSVFYSLLVLYRIFLEWQDKIKQELGKTNLGICQTTGNRETQSDRAQAWTSQAGTMAVLADGIGSANTGMVCAQIAVDTILDQFEPYHELKEPSYFFRTAFYEANQRIQKTIGERRGGACVGAVFVDNGFLHYAIVGDIRIALMRGNELIPLSKGQTIDILAAQAYEKGMISKQEAIWSMDEKQVWNYLGQDGFREIEISTPPIRLKLDDIVLVMSKGIFEELSWREIEDILTENIPMQELADRLVWEAEQKDSTEKENGSVILIDTTVNYISVTCPQKAGGWE